MAQRVPKADGAWSLMLKHHFKGHVTPFQMLAKADGASTSVLERHCEGPGVSFQRAFTAEAARSSLPLPLLSSVLVVLVRLEGHQPDKVVGDCSKGAARQSSCGEESRRAHGEAAEHGR